MPTALVTGATSGIGAVFVRHLASSGYRLVLVARDESRLTERRASALALGAPDVEMLPADLVDPAQRQAVVDRLSDTGRPVDLLVNNAGAALGKDFLESSQQELHDQIELLAVALTALTRAVLPGMVERGFGAVVNVASVAGLVPGRGSTYSAAKAFVISLTEGLAMSLRGTGVRITAVCPGFVRTEFHSRAGVDMSSTPSALYVDADKVVADAMRAIATRRPLVVPGALYKVMVNAARFAPRDLVRAVAARVNNQGRT